MTYKDIFEFIKSEENTYQTLPVAVVDGYEWNMADHIKKTILYSNSQFTTGNSQAERDGKPFKNITRPILNLHHRAEGFDVKDIELYVNSAKNYYKSFLVKKYHEKWARENQIDTFIDDLVETYVDFGGALVKNINEVKPEVVPWTRVAFCDQTDILSGPIAEKHQYSPDQLKEMEKKGWQNVDELIILAENAKKNSQAQGRNVRTPGKYIEVYEVHGMFPLWWLEDGAEESDYDPEDPKNRFVRQLHIVAFYQGQDNDKHGITLFKGKEKEHPYKLLLRDRIYGRALGFGGAEELFEPQVWVNYDQIRMKGMLDVASKVIFQTADTAFLNRNKVSDLDNGAVLVTEDGKNLAQINTTPVNIQVFENSVTKWEEHARQMGAANESIMGEQPTSGTPFKLQELVTAESHSLHEYRKGKIATFLEEVYREWIIPYLSREVAKGQEFLSELDLEELQYVAERVVDNEVNEAIKERILNGETIKDEEVDSFRDTVREEFMKGGNKRWMQILQGEMKEAPMDVSVNIVGKQKDLASKTDKLVNVFRAIISSVNPQTGQSVLDDPRMAKIFNEILESSGLSPVDFYQKPKEQPQMQPQMQQPQQINPALSQAAGAIAN